MVPGSVKGFNSDGQHGRCRLGGPKCLCLCCNFPCSFFFVRNRERVQVNTWLQRWCRREGFSYLDNWTLFWGRWDLYKQDVLHLNQRGTNILGGKFATALRGGGGLN